MSLTPETLRDLPEITAMTEFRFMGLPATAATAEVTETTETVIADLRTEAEEDCHNVRPDKPRQAITCSARQSRAELLAWRVT